MDTDSTTDFRVLYQSPYFPENLLELQQLLLLSDVIRMLIEVVLEQHH